jgi:hypothetical protein
MEPWRLTTLWAFTACYRESFTFTCIIFLCFVIGAVHKVLRIWSRVWMYDFIFQLKDCNWFSVSGTNLCHKLLFLSWNEITPDNRVSVWSVKSESSHCCSSLGWRGVSTLYFLIRNCIRHWTRKGESILSVNHLKNYVFL